MKFFALLLFLIFPLFALTNEVGSVGYIRVQSAFNDKKANTCFKALGADTKYRLGNECETWFEFGLYDKVTLPSGVAIHNQVRAIFLGANNSQVDFLRLDEAYSEVANLFDNSVSFWIGRRFYQRYDSYLSDYFYFNMSGDGFGFNNLDINLFKLSYSFMFSKVDPASVAGEDTVLFQSHDMRLNKELQRGELTLFINYMYLDSKKFNATQEIQNVDGVALGVLYKDKQLTEELFNMKGENISGLFYGEGLARGAATYSPYKQDSLVDSALNHSRDIKASKIVRFINYNAFEKDMFGFMGTSKNSCISSSKP